MVQIPALEIQAASPPDSTSLQAVAHLFQALHQRGIRYCHWKSTLRLEQALQGRTDLDLLVDRRHSQAFRQVLCEHNVKPALAAPGRRYPAVEDHLGFDPPSGRLFHLHVHYQLVLGEQFVKNYRLPLEACLLDSARLRLGVNIPAPEWELIVLALRALLKYRDRDAIKDLLSIRSPGLPAYILSEIEYLSSQTSRERIARMLTGAAGVAPRGVVLEFLDTVAAAPRAGYKLYRLRKRARRALRPYQRRPRWRAALLYFREMWQRRSFLQLSPARKMTLPIGGAVLALVGADGAGKTTLAQMLVKWLAGKLDVHFYYLGSKQPSRRSQLSYLAFRMARRSHRALCGALGDANVFSRWIGGLRDSFLCLHHLFIGQDRYRRYLAGRKKAAAGSLVIYDRYPLEFISTQREYRLLDGPQIYLTGVAGNGAIPGALARAEQNLYLKIRPPDFLFVLNVSPEVSMQRKPDHQRPVVEAKSRAVGDLASKAERGARKSGVIHLNADLPFEEVWSQLKTRVWEVL